MKESIILLMLIAFASVAIDHAFCSDKWIRIAAKAESFKHVSTSINYYWAVNTKDRIFICERPCQGSNTWREVGGLLTQLDVNDMEIWGVNHNNAVFKRPVDSSGNWKYISQLPLKHVSASGNGYIWGVNPKDDIFKCKKPCNGEWKQVPGKFKQIDGGEEYVFGSNAFWDVFRRPVDGSGEWYFIPGGKKLKYVSVGAGEVFGIDIDGSIFRCILPCDEGDWKEFETQYYFYQIEATVREVVGTAEGSLVLKKEV